MKSSDGFEKTLHALYDSVLEPMRLLGALQMVQRHLGCEDVHLFGWDTVAQQICLSLGPNDTLLAEAAADEVRTRHLHLAGHFLQLGGLVPGFFMLPGSRHSIGVCVYRDANVDIQLWLQNLASKAPFSEEQISRLSQLLPHLKRTIKLMRSWGAARTDLQTREQSLNALDHGVMALDQAARIVFANHRAQAILRQELGLRSEDGRLDTCVTTQDRKGLKAALRRVMASGQAESVALNDIEGRMLHAVTISRFPDASGLAGEWLTSAQRRADLLVLINTPGRQRVVTASQLAQLLNLTPAEARLAHGLAQGICMEGYQREQGLKESTVRTQLQAVLRKTGTRRQQDLVRLLACISSAR